MWSITAWRSAGRRIWMFDRGLIGLADDLTILVSRHVNDVDDIKAFINRSGRLSMPIRPADRPHPRFVQWHRKTASRSRLAKAERNRAAALGCGAGPATTTGAVSSAFDREPQKYDRLTACADGHAALHLV